jgi:hypothetical protein
MLYSTRILYTGSSGSEKPVCPKLVCEKNPSQQPVEERQPLTRSKPTSLQKNNTFALYTDLSIPVKVEE